MPNLKSSVQVWGFVHYQVTLSEEGGGTSFGDHLVVISPFHQRNSWKIGIVHGHFTMRNWHFTSQEIWNAVNKKPDFDQLRLYQQDLEAERSAIKSHSLREVDKQSIGCEAFRSNLMIEYDRSYQPQLHGKLSTWYCTLWWTNIAIENGHRNSGFSH